MDLFQKIEGHIRDMHDYYSKLNQKSNNDLVIAYSGYKADVLFDVICKIEELKKDFNG